VVDFVFSCQHECGGFGGNVGHDPHLLYTLSAIQILCLFDALERLADATLALGRRHTAVRERQLDVLVHRQIADQVEALEDEADATKAQLGEPPVVEPLGRLAVDDDAAACCASGGGQRRRVRRCCSERQG
jgi:hypothetical protein